MFLVCVRLSNVSLISNFVTKFFSATLIFIILSTFPSKNFGAMLWPTSDRGDTVRCQASVFGICDGKMALVHVVLQYFSFPCQYHSTNAPYPFTHLPPTL